MGARDKLLEDVGGETLLGRVVVRAVATGVAVLVSVPDLNHGRAAVARAAGAQLVAVPDWAEGMAASVRAGVAALPDRPCAVMILPGDMPDIESGDLTELIAAHGDAPSGILRATASDGTPGHPVIIPADLVGLLAHVHGDEGGRSVVRAHSDRLRLYPLRGDRAICDLDTPQDWARWRAGL